MSINLLGSQDFKLTKIQSQIRIGIKEMRTFQKVKPKRVLALVI